MHYESVFTRAKIKAAMKNMCSWCRRTALIPLVLFTRFLLLLAPAHPFHDYDMSVDGWNRHGTELFRLYAYVFNIMIVCVLVMLVMLWRYEF